MDIRLPTQDDRLRLGKIDSFRGIMLACPKNAFVKSPSQLGDIISVVH